MKAMNSLRILYSFNFNYVFEACYYWCSVCKISVEDWVLSVIYRLLIESFEVSEHIWMWYYMIYMFLLIFASNVKLISCVDPFHEVKSKREKKKEVRLMTFAWFDVHVSFTYHPCCFHGLNPIFYKMLCFSLHNLFAKCVGGLISVLGFTSFFYILCWLYIFVILLLFIC